MNRIRFGVVGCGSISRLFQLPALRRCPQAELVAVVDTDHHWAKSVARQFRAPHHFSDHRDLIGNVDAALIATPNKTHADIACGLLERGIHVMCEKPLATTRLDVERMFGTAARTGARLMAAHCSRFSPNLAALKSIVSAGWLGDLVEMKAGIGGPYDAGTQRTDFRKHKQLAGGGVLIDLGVHLIDLAVWLTGDTPTAVHYSAVNGPGWEVETDAEVNLEFAGGSRAVLAASFTHALDSAFTVRGGCGWAVAPWYQPTDLKMFSTRARVCQAGGVQHLRIPPAPMYDQQLAHFCEAVRSGKEFMVRPTEVRSVIDVIERCYSQGEANAA